MTEAKLDKNLRQTLENPDPELDHLTQDEERGYSEKDIEQWQAGAERFRQFWETVPSYTRKMISSKETVELQAVFLGEKPAIFLHSNSMVDIIEDSLFEEFGLTHVGRYIYDHEQVQKVIDEHGDRFKQIGIRDDDHFMDALSTASPMSYHIERGIILGYPVASVEAYEKQDKLQIDTDNGHHVNVHGIIWVDYAVSAESDKKQKRLRAAFEQSGIL